MAALNSLVRLSASQHRVGLPPRPSPRSADPGSHGHHRSPHLFPRSCGIIPNRIKATLPTCGHGRAVELNLIPPELRH